MQISLEKLHFGEGSAESEVNLKDYFIYTADYRQILTGRFNLITGGKGSGKSAIFSILSTTEFADKLIIPLCSVRGQVEYEAMFRNKQLNELTIDDFRQIWKKYIAVMMAGFVIKNSADRTPNEINTLKEFVKPYYETKETENFEVDYVLKEELIPEKIFELIDDILNKWNIELWALLDRLDETILTNEQNVQQNAIDSLFPIMKDLAKYPKIKLIMFLREDLRKQVKYQNIDHFNSTTRQLKWDRDNILILISKRIVQCCTEPNEIIEVTTENAKDIFLQVFENKVPESKSADISKWMYEHLMDGVGVATPRDFITLANYSKAEQESKNYSCTKGGVISGRAIINAHQRCAHLKYSDLIRINQSKIPMLENWLSLFSNPIVKENYGRFQAKDLPNILKGKTEPEIQEIVTKLINIGFLKPDDIINPLSSYKFEVPPVYRLSLGIKSTGRKREIS